MFTIESEEKLLRKLFESKLRIARMDGQSPDFGELEATIRQGRMRSLEERLRLWQPRYGSPAASQQALAYYAKDIGLEVRGFANTLPGEEA